MFKQFKSQIHLKEYLDTLYNRTVDKREYYIFQEIGMKPFHVSYTDEDRPLPMVNGYKLSRYPEIKEIENSLIDVESHWKNGDVNLWVELGLHKPLSMFATDEESHFLPWKEFNSSLGSHRVGLMIDNSHKSDIKKVLYEFNVNGVTGDKDLSEELKLMYHSWYDDNTFIIFSMVSEYTLKDLRETKIRLDFLKSNPY